MPPDPADKDPADRGAASRDPAAPPQAGGGTGARNPVELGPLSHDLPFMLRNLQALLRPEGQSIRDAMGIEGGGIGVLGLIWINPQISQNDLAGCLALRKSAVTKVVVSLEAQGLVRRTRAPGDRRTNALTLTEAGQEKIAIFRRLSLAMHERLFEGIGEADQECFFRVLATLYARLSAGMEEAD